MHELEVPLSPQQQPSTFFSTDSAPPSDCEVARHGFTKNPSREISNPLLGVKTILLETDSLEQQSPMAALFFTGRTAMDRLDSAPF